ncbi:uncharacterized protein [Amphiura filiformis]|uniref:uncharacterized protein n=1 Tax=Amphiura filiformis TaxID=82378 RepID=UPI003B21F15A
MDHPAFDLMTHKLGRSQANAQYYDPKRYSAAEKHTSPGVHADAKSREAMLYRGSQSNESSFPYQYSSHPQGVRSYQEEVKQRLSNAQQSYAAQNPRHGGVQDYSQVTAMQQQRQEYMQRIAQQQHQHILQQREYAERLAEQNNKMAATGRPRPPETIRSPRNIHGYGEHYDSGARQSAFTYTGAAAPTQHHAGAQMERRPTSIEAIVGAGFSSHQPNPNQAMMAARGIDPRQYHQQQEQYAARGQISSHPKEAVAHKAREQQVLREWEAQADQMYAKYAAAGARESPPKVANYPPLSPQQQGGQDNSPDQLDAELSRLKNMVRQMELMKEQRNNKYKSSAFQYLERLGSQEINSSMIAAAQTPASTASSKKPHPYHTMPPPHHSNPPKYNELLSPQKAPPNKYLNPLEHQQQVAYYQQHMQAQASQQRHHQQANQLRQHHTPSAAAHKKDVNPMHAMVVQGLPRIVDVRSLANGAAATVSENSVASLNRRRRSSEPLVVGDNRLVRVQTSSSPEGYTYEISDTRSADSCDSGVESLASPDAQISGHMYNRNAMVLAQQQQQLEAAKAQHAASIEAMKRQQHSINRQLNRNTAVAPNVRLERAGSPQKLSEIMEKDKVCPSMFKGIDSLTCKCQACVKIQEKTEIEIREIYRERKIKKLGAGQTTSKPPPFTTSALQNSSQQNDVIIIEPNEEKDGKEESKKRMASASSESTPDVKKLRLSATTGLNDDIVALDLSKKTVTSKPGHESAGKTPLGTKVQSNNDNISKTGNFLRNRHGSLTVEQVIASCMRQAEERISNCEKALLHHHDHGKTTSFEQIITECIDQEEQQGLNMKRDRQTTQNEQDIPAHPQSGQELANVHLQTVDLTKEQSKATEHVENLNHDKNFEKEGVVKGCRGSIDEQKKSKPSLERSNDDVSMLKQNQVFTSLKVMVEKLKVNSDMIVPAGDECVLPDEQTTLHRASSAPTLQQSFKGGDEIATRQRARSVGLSTTVSKTNEASAKYPIPRKGNLMAPQNLEIIRKGHCLLLPVRQYQNHQVIKIHHLLLNKSIKASLCINQSRKGHHLYPKVFETVGTRRKKPLRTKDGNQKCKLQLQILGIFQRILKTVGAVAMIFQAKARKLKNWDHLRCNGKLSGLKKRNQPRNQKNLFARGAVLQTHKLLVMCVGMNHAHLLYQLVQLTLHRIL